MTQQHTTDGVFVYVAEFDDGVEVKDVLPSVRNEAIAEARDPKLKRQRYCVWRLLDYALRDVVGKGVADLTFAKNEFGKWSCEVAHISLSHSAHAVSVAVSVTEGVGVDLEFVDNANFNSRLAERILTQKELFVYNNVTREEQVRLLAEFWTKKEAIFKRVGGAVFSPSAIDTQNDSIFSQFLHLSDGTCCLAVSTANNLPVVFRPIVNLEW